MNMSNVNQKLTPPVEDSARGAMMSESDLMSAVRSDACVLLTGRADAVRTVARRIHRLSGWREGPLTIVDCGRPQDMVERALFSVFTQPELSTAREPHPRLAQVGTVLLQDVWRLGPTTQARLADRLVQMRGKRLPGWSRWRLMASTSEPLLPRVIDGTFDVLLFYRLNVIHLVVSSESATEDTRGVSDVPNRYLVSHGAAPRALSFPPD
jgi:DNA-binding NtrC family response regulator